MPELSKRIQKADWKKEKHVPVIECPDQVKADEFFEVKASLGKEIAHPNTTEHHIRWISVYFQVMTSSVANARRILTCNVRFIRKTEDGLRVGFLTVYPYSASPKSAEASRAFGTPP